MLFRRGSLGRRDESSTDPDGLSAKHEHRGESATIVDASGGDHMNLNISELLPEPSRSIDRRLSA